MARSTRSPSAARRSVAAVLVVGGLALAAWAVADREDTAIPATGGPPEVLSAEPVTTIRTQPPRRDPAAGPPQRVRVPSLGVDAPVVGIPVTGGVLTPPSDPQVLGWWVDGAAPGQLRGGALVTGHTVSVGGGALDDLEQVPLGGRVEVRTATGVISYRVTKVDIYRKASLARHAQTVFSQTGPGRLVLVTCEDWDGTRYLSNVVVYADPVQHA